MLSYGCACLAFWLRDGVIAAIDETNLPGSRRLIKVEGILTYICLPTELNDGQGTITH